MTKTLSRIIKINQKKKKHLKHDNYKYGMQKHMT